MDLSDVKDLVNDSLEKRFEGYAQTQIKLHEDYHEKLLLAVESQIKTTVNGKIDNLTKVGNELDKKMIIMQTTIDDMAWLAEFTKGAGLLRKPLGWLVMFVLGAVALLGGFKSLLSFFVPR